MARKSVQRFCANDMRKNKDLKRKERIGKIATRFRLQTQSCPPNDESSDVASCLEVDHKLVVSCCDAPPILQAAEGAFNNIPALVGNGVEGLHALSSRIVGNDRLRAAGGEEVA
jgi:hypothetical protein